MRISPVSGFPRKDSLKTRGNAPRIYCFNPSAIRNDETRMIRRTNQGGKKEVRGHREKRKASPAAIQAITETSSSLTSGATSRTALATAAGAPCSRLTQPEFLSLPACRTVRLLMEESSISARIACRSSEAEITGNNRTSAHPESQQTLQGSYPARRPQSGVLPPQPVSRQHQQQPRQIEQEFHNLTSQFQVTAKEGAKKRRIPTRAHFSRNLKPKST